MIKNKDICVKTESTKAEFLTAKELKLYVKAAQEGDQNAIAKLCEAFTPLIMKEAHRPSIHKILGEDAEGIAWEAFLSYIHNYSGNKFLSLPGLLKVYIHYKLLHSLHQEGTLMDCDALDATYESFEVADERDSIRECENKLILNDVLNTLNIRHKELLIELYLNNKSLKEYAVEHNMLSQVCITLKNRAFKRARRIFKELVQDYAR